VGAARVQFCFSVSLHCSLDCALGVVLFAVEKFGAGDIGGRWIRWAAGF